MDRVRTEVRASMVILAGDDDAELPEEPEDAGVHVVVPGPEAIYVSGRVEYDAPTLIRVGDLASVDTGDLVLAYTGALATPEGKLRFFNMEFDVLGETEVTSKNQLVSIYLSNLREPDEILVALH